MDRKYNTSYKQSNKRWIRSHKTKEEASQEVPTLASGSCQLGLSLLTKNI